MSSKVTRTVEICTNPNVGGVSMNWSSMEPDAVTFSVYAISRSDVLASVRITAAEAESFASEILNEMENR